MEPITKLLAPEKMMILGPSEPFWTKQLFLACLIALAIHALCLLFFHVNLFKITGEQATLPPVQVHSDTDLLSTMTSSNPLDEPVKWQQTIGKPKKSQPHISYHPTAFPPSELIVDDQDWLLPSLDLPECQGRTLAIRTIGYSNPITHLSAIPSNFAMHTVVYEVRIDEKTGTILWYEEAAEQQLAPSIRLFFEKILKEIRFEKSLKKGIAQGWVEFEVAQG